MMPSPSIHDRSDARHSCWLSACSAPACRRSARSARSHTANLLAQRAIRSFTPTRTPTLQGKAIGSAASTSTSSTSRRGQIPIAPAAPSVPHTPRFRALALFGRRPPQRVDGLGIPASENLHRTGCERIAARQPLTQSQSPRRRGEPCRWDPETYALARWSPHT